MSFFNKKYSSIKIYLVFPKKSSTFARFFAKTHQEIQQNKTKKV